MTRMTNWKGESLPFSTALYDRPPADTRPADARALAIGPWENAPAVTAGDIVDAAFRQIAGVEARERRELEQPRTPVYAAIIRDALGNAAQIVEQITSAEDDAASNLRVNARIEQWLSEYVPGKWLTRGGTVLDVTHKPQPGDPLEWLSEPHGFWHWPNGHVFRDLEHSADLLAPVGVWLEHDGGECPVPIMTRIGYRTRDGEEIKNAPAVDGAAWRNGYVTHFRIEESQPEQQAHAMSHPGPFGRALTPDEEARLCAELAAERPQYIALQSTDTMPIRVSGSTSGGRQHVSDAAPKAGLSPVLRERAERAVGMVTATNFTRASPDEAIVTRLCEIAERLGRSDMAQLDQENARLRGELVAARIERDNWRADAQRYAGNADHWRERAEGKSADNVTRIEPFSDPEPRSESWPPPSHKPRMLP